ncbi:hypothetical protein ACFSL6_09445 [Paenibacillus thailandensis]|uniref:Uncharacterized protein n=1 Tax=Paenibacillus thailandensis TaxID=393250 RepID=A0ABW5R3A4_9BACL
MYEQLYNLLETNEFEIEEADPSVLWGGLLSLNEKMHREQPAKLLAECLDLVGGALDSQDPLPIDHFAYYIGEYRNDKAVFDWIEFMYREMEEERIRSLDYGPSYIVPLHYGTQGWWLSIGLNDGTAVELFACKQFGPWLRYPKAKRLSLMSHPAYRVGSKEDVFRFVDRYRGTEGYEILKLTEEDSVGHTYGHIRNNRTNRVVEIVYSSSN